MKTIALFARCNSFNTEMFLHLFVPNMAHLLDGIIKQSGLY